jgi:RNA polymerase sigma-70 factor (ECF subfamily)
MALPPSSPPAVGDPSLQNRDGAAQDLNEPSDAALVKQAREGDSKAFEFLMNRYKALVCLVAYRQLGQPDQVDDVAQEAFVKSFTHLQELEEPGRFKFWLLRITANIAFDHLRKRKHDGVSLDDTKAFAAAESAAASDPRNRNELQTAGERAAGEELRAEIVEAIYSLPEDYQMLASMRYLEEIPYREIAQRTGLREDTLRKRLHRANQMLRRKLKKWWPEPDVL